MKLRIESIETDTKVIIKIPTQRCAIIIESHHEKTNILHMRKQRHRSASPTSKLISTFVFATGIVT